MNANRIRSFIRSPRRILGVTAARTKRFVRLRIAGIRRARYRDTLFIGVTGSHSKSTTVAFVSAMLARRSPTFSSGTANTVKSTLRHILKTPTGKYGYFVQEMSAAAPGEMTIACGILRPHIGIVTAVLGDHRKAFGGSWEAIAAEKGQLIRSLPADGLAVLNADDPLVDAMAEQCGCRVVRFGHSESADLRILEARSRWPERLSLTASYRGERLEIATRLVGVQWSTAVGAALLAALELGVDRNACIATLAELEPLEDRLSVCPGPNGAVHISDAHKSSFHGLEASMSFLREASAPRKTIVFGTISDYAGSGSRIYRKVARLALGIADRTVFTGPNAGHVGRLAANEFPDRLFAFQNPAEAAAFISKTAIPDEIIYVKATKNDHLAGHFSATAVGTSRQASVKRA